MKDKIMNFPLIRFIINLRICQWAANNPVLSRFCNYEVISYLVCGVLTTIVSYVSYFLVRIFSGVLISQCISWVLAVAFAYVSNKIFVFLSDDCFKKGTDSFYKLPYLFLFCRYCLHGNYSQSSLLE